MLSSCDCLVRLKVAQDMSHDGKSASKVSSLMADCSNESGTASTYSDSYHSFSEIILGA